MLPPDAILIKKNNLPPDAVLINKQETAPVKKPGFIESAMTNLSRPGASVRERYRTLANTGDIKLANQKADEAWKNPESSKTFQEQDLVEYYKGENPSALKTARGLDVSAVGLAKDFISDPVQIALGLATEGVIKGVSPIKYKGISIGQRASELPASKMLASEEGQALKGSKYAAKAIKPTEQLLKPKDKEFAKSIEMGTSYNPSEQASKYISKAKDYTELTDQMRLASGFPMEERAGIYKSSVSSPERTHLNNLDELMMKESNPKLTPQANSPQSNSRLRQYGVIRDAEVDSLKAFSKEELSSPEFWQKRKAYYQSEADKAGAYTGNEKMSARAEAYRALARGAQDKTYELDEAIKQLNLENAGLSEAQKRFSQLAQVERGQAPPSISQEIAQSVRPSEEGFGAAMFRKLAGKGYTDVPKLTKLISKNTSKSQKAYKLSELISQMKSKPSEAKILELTGRQPNQIEFKKTPQIPQVLESDFKRLAKEYGIPEGNVRERITEFEKFPTMRSNKMTEANKILARRKKNFGGK